MNPVTTYALRGLKTRKVQTVALFIIFTLVSLGMFASLGLMNSLQKPFDSMFDEAKAGHIHMAYKTSDHPDAEAYWKGHQGIEGVAVLPSISIYKNPTVNDKQIQIFTVVTENITRNLETLKLLEGNDPTGPKPGEIWVTPALATSYSIEIGDHLRIPGELGMADFTVSGIVLDPHFSTSQINPTRVWVAPGTIKEKLAPDNDEQTLEIRYSSYDQKTVRKDWNAFRIAMGGNVYGMNIDMETTRHAYTFILTLNGSFMMIFAILILVVSLIILGLTMSGVILSDYRQIGILRANGYSIFQVRASYGLQMLFTAASGLIAGIPLGYMLLRTLIDGFTKSSGLSAARIPVFMIAFLTAVFLLGMVMLMALIATRSIKRIRPYQAIQFGTSAKQKNMPIKKKVSLLPLPLFTGLRELRNEPRHAWVIGLLSAMMVFILMMAADCRETMVGMALEGYFSGNDRTDFGISAIDPNVITDEELVKILDTNPDVVTHSKSSYLENSFMDTGDPEEGELQVLGSVYDDKIDTIEFFSLSGNLPSNRNEIVVSTPMARLAGVETGDYITITLEKVKARLMVSGMFETANNGGMGFIVRESALPESAKPINYSHRVQLKKGVDAEKWLEQNFGKYGTAVNFQNNQQHMKTFSAYLSNLIMTSSIPMALILLAICMLTVFNLTIIHLLRVQRQHGVWLALGRSSKSIRLSVLIKDLIPLVIGGVIGLLTAFGIMPTLFNMIFGMLGFTKIHVVHALVIVIGSIPLTALPILLASWLTSGRIRKISPRELIVD